RDKLPEADRTRAEGVIAEARKDLESNDVARMDAARQRVEKEMHAIAELLYRAQTAETAGGGEASASGGAKPAGDGDVIDAEYTEEQGGGGRPNSRACGRAREDDGGAPRRAGSVRRRAVRRVAAAGRGAPPRPLATAGGRLRDGEGDRRAAGAGRREAGRRPGLDRRRRAAH